MSHILAPAKPLIERRRLLGQAKHCRELASALEDADSIDELVALARSYEAKAALIAER